MTKLELLHYNRLFLKSKQNITFQLPFYKKNFKYSVYFTSLLTPNFTQELDFFHNDNTKPLPTKLHLKRSYLALSWFYYISKTLNPSRNDAPCPKLAILPSKRSLYTLSKAPMAHKTNSKEQFMFKFYFFKFSFSLLLDKKFLASSLNEALLAFFLIRKTFPIFETNLLFIKYYHVQFLFHENFFYNFDKFSKNHLN